jgi:hypothetical protein
MLPQVRYEEVNGPRWRGASYRCDGAKLAGDYAYDTKDQGVVRSKSGNRY